jgi:hypothetical protein
MPIVTGEVRLVDGGPTDISIHTLALVEKAIEAKTREQKMQSITKRHGTKPEPPLGFTVFFSPSNSLWVCVSKVDRTKFLVWDQSRWIDYGDFEKGKNCPPHCSDRPSGY